MTGLTREEFILHAKEVMATWGRVNQGKLVDFEQDVYNCLRLALGRLQAIESVDIVYLAVEDWEGLYVNGLLEDEGHSVGVEDWIKKNVGNTLEIRSYDYFYFDSELDAYGNRFPDLLREVVEYKVPSKR